jgi:NADH dehydrogenase
MARNDPLEDKLVVLIGGTGFIGSHVAQDLLERGARVRIAAREPERAFRLKPLANLGQLQFARIDVKDRASLAAAIAGAHAVAYLVGTFGSDQKALQADGAGHAAKSAAEAGAQVFVYVSSIGADAAKESGYYRSKGTGEQLVLEAFPKATVIRPSAVFGEEGGFVPMFAEIVSMMPLVPVFGSESRLQPVWVDDLAQAIGNALADPNAHGGKTYEATGPQALTMREIYEAIANAQHRERTLLPVPDMVAGILAALPLMPINGDQLAMLREGNVATEGMPCLAKLGVTAKPLSLFLDRWMVRYRKHGRFGAKREPA